MTMHGLAGVQCASGGGWSRSKNLCARSGSWDNTGTDMFLVSDVIGKRGDLRFLMELAWIGTVWMKTWIQIAGTTVIMSEW